MKRTAAYFELTNLMGLYANYITCGAYDRVPELFTADARADILGEKLAGAEALRAHFAARADEAARRGVPEFFTTFGQLSEIREDAGEARCLWMFLWVCPDPAAGTALHQIGRMDMTCVREGGVFRIQELRQFVRTRLEPVPYVTGAPAGPLTLPGEAQHQFDGCADDPEIGEMLEVVNEHSRYEQYLHCGNWDMVDTEFCHEPDTSWTVGNTRKRFLAEHPDYVKEPDGPADTDEPPYWMGAKVGHEAVIKEGFGGMTIPFGPENQGLYCCSDMLQPLVAKSKVSGRIYTSVPSYGGFIMGPGMGMTAPFGVLSSIGRWLIEWILEDGRWKMYHFCWRTIYEICADRYDPAHRADWLSTHGDVHIWPELPKPY